MLRRFPVLWICISLLALTGCSIAGSWTVVGVDPPGVPFPIDSVTFGEDNSYTASQGREGQARTSTGQYKWNGFNLDVGQLGRVPRTYGASLRLNGTLVLTYEQGGAKVKATLAKGKRDP